MDLSGDIMQASMFQMLCWLIYKDFILENMLLAVKALEIIKQQLSVRLPIDEAGFIVFHFVVAELDSSGDQDDMGIIIQIMNNIINLVKRQYEIEFNYQDIYYMHFVTHLKFFTDRIVRNKQQEDYQVDLLEIITRQYQTASPCKEEVKKYILKKYKHHLSQEEEAYLTLHIHRLISTEDLGSHQ